VIVTVLCLVADRAGAVHEAAHGARGRLVIGDLGRAGRVGRTAPRQSVARIKAVAVRALLDGPRSIAIGQVCGLDRRSSAWVCLLPADRCTGPLARLDCWFGTITTVGAAFIALAARKPATDTPTRTESS
jgi:hypothetical protein